jgi:hypothetical protein
MVIVHLVLWNIDIPKFTQKCNQKQFSAILSDLEKRG